MMSEVALFFLMYPFWKEKRQQQLFALILPFDDALTLSSGISCSARVPIMQQLLHNTFGRLHILACPCPRLPCLVHNAVLLTKAKKNQNQNWYFRRDFLFPFGGNNTTSKTLKYWPAVGMHKSSSLASQQQCTWTHTTEFETQDVFLCTVPQFPVGALPKSHHLWKQKS